MNLTPENKAHIDSMGVLGLLEGVRFAPVGDPWFQGETGQYWMMRLKEEREKDPGGAVAASKRIGWDAR